MTCHICESTYSDMFKWIKCESFDDSHLYKDIDIEKCRNCGHLYNQLNTKQLQGLMKYYQEEYAPTNLSSKDKTGDRPGSNNEATIKRYEQLYNFISPYITSESRILDVGCAMGGFINFLKDMGHKNVYGIDMIKAYVDEADNENIKQGDVYVIPFEDNSFDIVILDQVLEHLINPKLAMDDIKRVLDKGGLCYIAVPDADRYNDDYFYLMREHIQHFKDVNLKILAHSTGFEVINYWKTEFDMIGSLKLPYLAVLLKLNGTIYCWGIGREFMYLYPHTRLKYRDLILIDDTPYKQKQTFKGMKIHSSDILKEADKDSFLIITAKTHLTNLVMKSYKLGYKGQIIDV